MIDISKFEFDGGSNSYTARFMNKFHPGVDVDCETGELYICESTHGYIFADRYNNEEIRFPKTYKQYCADFSDKVVELGLNPVEFWFLMVYIYDSSKYNINNPLDLKTPMDEIKELFDLTENKITYKEVFSEKIGINENVTIDIKIDGKVKTSITKGAGVLYLLELIKKDFEAFDPKGRHNNLFGIEGAKEKAPYNMMNYMIIKKMYDFFELYKAEIKRFNKSVFCEELLFFLGNTKIATDYIPNTLKYYKKKEIPKSLLYS